MIENHFNNIDKNEMDCKIEKEKQDNVVQDFEDAFLAGFMHYRNDAQNRFPGAIRLLYKALYDTDELDKIMNADVIAQQNNRLERRLAEIKNISKYACLEGVPTIEEFERALRLSLRHGADALIDDRSERVSYNKENIESFQDALYPDVPVAMNNLWDKYDAQMVIWTAGDSSPWKGQFYKVVNALYSLRKDKNFGGRKNDMLSIVAENDKMNYLSKILLQIKERGINKIILVEDRLKHLQEGQDVSQMCGVPNIPVWVRREGTEFADIYNEKNIGENAKIALQEKYNAVGSFADAQKKLEQKKLIEEGDVLGMIIDFDGVLSDTSATNRIWATSIVNTLKGNNWIK